MEHVGFRNFELLSPPSGDFWTGVLSERAQTAIKRQRKLPNTLAPVEEHEALALLSNARKGLDLASEDAVRRMYAKNPDILRLVKSASGKMLGLFAYMPLSEFGAMMLARGQFDGAAPDPAWIVRAGVVPAAFYEWLFFGPGEYLRSLPAIGEEYHRLAPNGCPVFSRGATDVSAGILLKLGYMDARSIYPEAQSGLVVVLPQRVGVAPPPPKTKTEIRQVRSFEELAHVFSIRSATYLAEQFPLYGEEFDGNDFCATHFVGYIDGDPAGAVRARYFADFVKLERLAVKLEYRKSRLAFALCRTAAAHVRQKGFTRIYGHASDEVAPFWRLLGGSPMEGRPQFQFANVTYNEMSMELEPDPLAVRYGAPPMTTIRPEGLWDEASSLDWSNLAQDDGRAELLAAHARGASK